MANPEHVEILKQGTEEWNAYVEALPLALDGEIFRADLFGANLRRTNLGEANLREADLREADLSGANLREADLSGANLREANLREAFLRGANLLEADLSGADLRGADLFGANLFGEDLRRADLRGANLREADLFKANLMEANVRSVKIEYGSNVSADWIFTELEDANNLRQDQLDSMKGDSGTIIPDHLTRPAHWPELEDLKAQRALFPNTSPNESDLKSTLGYTSEQALEAGHAVLRYDQAQDGLVVVRHSDLSPVVEDVFSGVLNSLKALISDYKGQEGNLDSQVLAALTRAANPTPHIPIVSIQEMMAAVVEMDRQVLELSLSALIRDTISGRLLALMRALEAVDPVAARVVETFYGKKPAPDAADFRSLSQALGHLQDLTANDATRTYLTDLSQGLQTLAPKTVVGGAD